MLTITVNIFGFIAWANACGAGLEKLGFLDIVRGFF